MDILAGQHTIFLVVGQVAGGFWGVADIELNGQGFVDFGSLSCCLLTDLRLESSVGWHPKSILKKL